MYSPMASEFIPLKGVNKQDWALHGDTQDKIKRY